VKRPLKPLWILFATFIVAPAFADGMIVDLGDRGTNTGYAQEIQSMPGDAQKILEYQWVCPPDSERPPDGIVTIQVSDVDSHTIALGKRQCWNNDAQHIVNMVKEYNPAYYVVGGTIGDLPRPVADHGGSGAAAAANAAGAAAGGYYNSCTANPFALCSGPEPGSHDSMHACWDAVCPIGR